MIKTRSLSRSHVLQILFQFDVQPLLNVEAGLAAFRKQFDSKGADEAFVERLIRGVASNLKSLDSTIAVAASHWRIDWMSKVDRNILRLGTYELLYCEDIPATVTINEMIELAKNFGEESSSGFVNAVLDRIRIDNPRENKVP